MFGSIGYTELPFLLCGLVFLGGVGLIVWAILHSKSKPDSIAKPDDTASPDSPDSPKSSE